MKVWTLAAAAVPAAGARRYARRAATILCGLGRPLRTRLRLMLWGRYHPRYFPRDVRTLARDAAHEAALLRHRPLESSWGFIAVPAGSDDHRSSRVLRLAGAYVGIDALPEYWREPSGHRDAEQTSASHRFHWAVEWHAAGLTTAAAEQIAATIAAWLVEFSTSRSGEAWQPYTVSERICNWLVLLPALRHHGTLSDRLQARILEALPAHVGYLAEHLEYPAGGLVNNHILNNARALYLAGSLLGLPASQRLGRALFERHLPSMVTDSGYLGEASSHYQLLLTRSVLECTVVARHVGDEPFAAGLGRVATMMLEACRRLFPSELQTVGDGPRIGDVSPDIPFGWLSPGNGSWRRVWPTAPTCSLQIQNRSGMEDGWLLLDAEGWALRAFVHPARDTYPTGHGHPDFGSFWLAWHGKAIVIDMGRLTYAPDAGELLSGAEAESHGVVLVNGRPLLPERRGLRARLAGESVHATSCRVVADGRAAIWSVLGPNGIRWQRTIELTGERAVITDRLNGAGRSRVESLFLLAPSFVVDTVNPGAWRLCDGGVHMRADCRPASDWSLDRAPLYPEYGVAMSAPCLRWCRLDVEEIEIAIVLTPGVAP